MDKQQFIEKLCMCNSKCMILDDELINPNEIIIFTREKRNLSREIKGLGIEQTESVDGRIRNIRIITYKEAGITTWEKNLWMEGKLVGSTVALLNKEDSLAYFLYYAYTQVQTQNWLYHNIIYVMKDEMNFRSEGELIAWLAAYMQKKKYGIEINGIINLPKELLMMLSPVTRKMMTLRQIWRKGMRKIQFKCLGINASLHMHFTKRKYLKYLQKTSAVGDNWKVTEENGASVSIFVKDVRENGMYFIKGNEMSAYQGIKNEVMIQKMLLENSKKNDWFLPMVASDSLQRWIKYEYVTWPLLSNYIEEKGLTEKERSMLGEYLVEVLDYLFSLNIVHNDLRAENIMVRTDSNGMLEGFVLIDFGCASYNGMIPWKNKSFLGRYIGKAVCGTMRYNEVLIDDAASAHLIYVKAGGSVEDEVASKIRERIGRLFFSGC